MAAFRDEHIDAIVAEGSYREPRAAEHVAAVLKANRDNIARYFFDRVTPLDFFRHTGDAVAFEDLGMKYRVYPGTTPRYRVRCAMVDEDRSAEKSSRTDWVELTSTELPLTSGPANTALARHDGSHPFLAMEFQVDRGDGWSNSVTAYLAPTGGRIIAVNR